MKFHLRLIQASILLGASFLALIPAKGQDIIQLQRNRQELVTLWRTRIKSFLDKGIIPLVDVESSLKHEDAERYLGKALKIMDSQGIALIAFDAYQAPKRHKKQKGYRWSYYLHEKVNKHPDRIILATNGGTNNNWLEQKDSFVNQTVEHVKSGEYPIMGEFDFRHYLSQNQCKKSQTERDSNIPINSPNGHQIFSLSQESGIAFSIHLEPEDTPIAQLEEMLAAYPKANVIWAHFGQIRFPDKEKSYTPTLIRRLLSTYPNLYIDLATGFPGRRYRCNKDILDTVIWQDADSKGQKNTLKNEYQAILTEFSDRFVFGSDYGGGRKPLTEHLKEKAKNVRLIMKELPDRAQHQISYQNAWLLLTGQEWRAE